MKKFAEEFKKFISRGNVLDMAIGVVIAGAFGKITTSLVNDLLMPFIAWVCGSRDMTALNVVVRPEVINEAGEVTQNAIVLGFGTFVGTIIDFLLIALTVFLIVRAFNTAREKAEAKKKAQEAAAAAEQPPEEPKPTTEELLAEILEELKKKN